MRKETPAMKSFLKNKSILLIITGSIAAYKCAELVRRLIDNQATVKCVMTSAAQQFITPLLMASLSQHQVYTDLWSLKDETEMGHIRLSRDADVILIAPASANCLAKLSHGLCDDLASTLLMATDKPVLIAPAMNPMMWQNAATQANLRLLQARGITLIPPSQGDMACGETGTGRMAEVADILTALDQFFQFQGALKGKKVIVTSGSTHEAIDPVRFIGNHSSGKQGNAIAEILAMAGADTTLITGHTTETPPANVTVRRISSADEMLEATLAALPADIVICAAAVADWKPAAAAQDKIKKGTAAPVIALLENKDILKTVAQMSQNRPRLVIGFAAETEKLIEHARQKLSTKKCDWILANDVSPETGAFGGDFNTIHFITPDREEAWPRLSKQDIARKLVTEIIKSLQK
jgi:phosphopantothenoylcysteine decarboxylase/phosphopantothenate--cysteine ligase